MKKVLFILTILALFSCSKKETEKLAIDSAIVDTSVVADTIILVDSTKK